MMKDFNLPNLPSIRLASGTHNCGLLMNDELFYQCFASLGLVQWVKQPNIYYQVIFFISRLASLLLNEKKSSVTLVFKKGSNHNSLLYKFVSLTFICARAMDHVLTKFIYGSAQSNNLWTRISVASDPIHLWRISWSLISVRSSSTFMLISHFCIIPRPLTQCPLLKKMYKYGIRERLLLWMRQFWLIEIYE